MFTSQEGISTCQHQKKQKGDNQVIARVLEMGRDDNNDEGDNDKDDKDDKVIKMIMMIMIQQVA